MKKNVARVKASTIGENEATDELLDKTHRQLLTYLRTHELSKVDADKLGLDLSVDSQDKHRLKVYTYSYSSGGTRGTIHCPIFQWKNTAGKLFVYAPAIECGFYQLHTLSSPGRTMYLLLGDEKGDSRCMQRIAHVVELKGDYLLLDTPTFATSASLTLCNVPMVFDPRKQVLCLDVREFDFAYYQPEDEPYRLLKRWGFVSLATTTTLALRFNGQRFITLR